MTVNFDHKLMDEIASTMLEYDANMDTIRKDFEQNFGKDVVGELHHIVGMDDWRVSIENEFRDVAEDYINGYVNQMSESELVDWINRHVDDYKLENYLNEYTDGECNSIEDVQNSKNFGKEILADIVYFGLTETDYATANTFADYVLYEFSYMVADSCIDR